MKLFKQGLLAVSILLAALGTAFAQVPSQICVKGTNSNSCIPVDATNPFPVTGSGGGGGAVTIANGADVALGNTADAAWVSGSGTVVAILKNISANAAASSITKWGDGTLGAMANYGTSPGAVLVPGVNAFITNAPTVAQATAANLNATVVGTGTFAVQAAQTGTWTVTGAGGTFPATQSGTWNIGTLTSITNALPAGNNVLGHVIADSGSTTAVTQATAANLNATVVGTGTFAVQAAQSGTWTVQPGNTANTTAWLVSPQAATAGGSSTTGNIAANNTTAVVVKASAGVLYSVQLAGIGSAPAYLKLYDATSATCGSGTPVKRLMIPAASTAANGAGSNITFPVGVTFATGITYCVTTGITDADTTAPAASTFLINIDYK